jgi:2-dehydro-3-deoxyphosphogluconate aldolase/(4S)-4-hydroxy-2-oxoglutarate aldolase
MDVKKFKNKPVMGIVRGVEPGQIEPLIEAVVESGLETLEITMNTRSAPEIIRKAKKAAGKRLMLGAGTVIDMDSLKQALNCGATFIVMPVFIKDVVRYCLKNKIPVFPGALTPAEIFNAWQEGATMVKVFPAKFFGPEYFREIKGPFNDIELLACAGVTPGNMRDYFTCGASAIAFGASVFRQDWLQKKDFLSIASAIKAYLKNIPVVNVR